MSRIFFLALIFTFLNVNAQDKKTYYFDEDSNKMSQAEFLKTNNGPDYFFHTYDLDTSFVSISFKYKNRKKLNPEDLNNLVSSLEKTSKRTINDSEFIVINYYPGKDESNFGNTQSKKYYNSNYLRQLNKITPVSQFYIYKSLEDSKTSEGMEWLKDENQTVEKLFFKFHFSCYSFVIIKPNGEYISYYGEHGLKTILDAMKELSSK